jgi:hypothetical protein
VLFRSELYKTLSEKLDGSEQAKLFARAANIMRQAGHPDKAFEFYMNAYNVSKNGTPSNGQQYLVSAIKTYPQHSDAPKFAKELANDYSAKASKLAEERFVFNAKERLPNLLEAIFQYNLAAEIIAPFSTEQQIEHLGSAYKIYQTLLSDIDYFSHFGNGQYLKLVDEQKALGAQIAKLVEAAKLSPVKAVNQPSGDVTVPA